jgi:uncharacterized protein
LGYLADVNFLVAILHARHVFSRRAVSWVDKQEEPGSILFCRVVQMGALRLLTDSRWLKTDVQPAAAVWGAWDQLLLDRRFARVEEPPRIEAEWRRLTRALASGRCADTDAYLAAFARVGGYRLLTFDRGFEQFEGLDVEILSEN